MRYDLFRLSLMANTRPSLFTIRDADTSTRIERQAYLREEFKRRVDFLYRGHEYSYVYVDEADGTVVARLGRSGYEAASSTPDERFVPIYDERFQAVNVYLDTKSDPGGQKIAMQYDRRIGKPNRILQVLVHTINNRVIDPAYEIAIHPIIHEESFWGVVEKYKREITTLQITLTAPNVLGLGASIPKEMEAAKRENNVSTATVTLENKNGINVDTPDIRQAVTYVAAGGGEATLKKRGRILFTTRTSRDSVTIPNDAPVAVGFREAAAAVAKAIFGR